MRQRQHLWTEKELQDLACLEAEVLQVNCVSAASGQHDLPSLSSFASASTWPTLTTSTTPALTQVPSQETVGAMSSTGCEVRAATPAARSNMDSPLHQEARASGPPLEEPTLLAPPEAVDLVDWLLLEEEEGPAGHNQTPLEEPAAPQTSGQQMVDGAGSPSHIASEKWWERQHVLEQFMQQEIMRLLQRHQPLLCASQRSNPV